MYITGSILVTGQLVPGRVSGQYCWPGSISGYRSLTGKSYCLEERYTEPNLLLYLDH